MVITTVMRGAIIAITTGVLGETSSRRAVRELMNKFN
jgi:hypothetical protein